MALIKIADKYYKIPVYVQKLMSRASFAIGYGEPGHTLEIEKATPYTCVYTLRAEVERFVVWINRIMTKACLLYTSEFNRTNQTRCGELLVSTLSAK